MAWTENAGVIRGGEQRLCIFLGTSATLTANDIVGEATTDGISGIGASKEVIEVGGFHYMNKHKNAGQSTPNDVTIKCNLTLTEYATRKTQYTSDTDLYLCVADKTGTVVYGAKGTLTSWSAELTGDGNACTYSIVFSPSDTTVTVTPPEYPSGGYGQA